MIYMLMYSGLTAIIILVSLKKKHIEKFWKSNLQPMEYLLCRRNDNSVVLGM